MNFRIDEITAAVAAALQTFLQAHAGQPVRIYVSNEGGPVGIALQMANAIRAHGQVTTVADGLAASAATLPLMAGQRVEAHAGTLLMFHQPHAGAGGTAADMQAAAEALTAAATLMGEIYAARGLNQAQVSELMGEADKWLTAAQAQEMGLLDAITNEQVSAQGSLKIAARLANGVTRTEVEAMLRNNGQTGAPLNIGGPGSGAHTQYVPQQPTRAQAASEALLIRAGVVKDNPANPLRGTRLLDMESEFARPSAAFGMGVDAFPGVLSDAANRALGLMFDEVMEPWRTICQPLPVPDFREVSLASLGAISTPPDIGEHTDISFGDRSDTHEKTALATTGLQFALTRRALVNDDLMVFSETPRALAIAVARRIGDAFAAIVTTGNTGTNLTDGTAIFAAARNNAGNTAISSASLDAARSSMALQKDPSGIPSGHRMAWLWVPEALVGTARTILTAEYSVKNPPGDSQSTAPNEARGLIASDAVIGDYRLDEASATKWYAVARGAFRRLHLEGQDSPMIDERSLDNRDGYAWRVIHDYRVVAVGHTGIYLGGA